MKKLNLLNSGNQGHFLIKRRGNATLVFYKDILLARIKSSIVHKTVTLFSGKLRTSDMLKALNNILEVSIHTKITPEGRQWTLTYDDDYICVFREGIVLKWDGDTYPSILNYGKREHQWA